MIIMLFTIGLVGLGAAMFCIQQFMPEKVPSITFGSIAIAALGLVIAILYLLRKVVFRSAVIHYILCILYFIIFAGAVVFGLLTFFNDGIAEKMSLNEMMRFWLPILCCVGAAVFLAASVEHVIRGAKIRRTGGLQDL